MQRAYLDANIYNDIECGAVPRDDIEAVCAAKKSGALTIRLSICDLEESVFAVCNNNPALALRRLTIMRDVAAFDSLLHQPADVLEMSLRAYATGTLRPSPLLPPAQRLQVASRISETVGNPKRFAPMLSEIVASVQGHKQSMYDMMAQSRERALKEIKERRWSRRNLRKLTFDEYFTAGAESWAQDLARPHGLADACRERGLDGLVKVPAVRVTVGVLLSEIFAEIVDERHARASYAYDIWHAIQAATGAVFVTNDERLRTHMNRIPGPPIVQTVKSLRELLETLG
jgi:hypothetical protein